MATFNITVTGVVIPPLLGPPAENVSSCISTFDIEINAIVGHSIKLDFTPTGGYTSYTCQLDVGAGYVSISNTTHTFTIGVVSNLRLILPNTGIVESLNVQIDATNQTVANTGQRIVNRLSTGTIC